MCAIDYLNTWKKKNEVWPKTLTNTVEIKADIPQLLVSGLL